MYIPLVAYRAVNSGSLNDRSNSKISCVIGLAMLATAMGRVASAFCFKTLGSGRSFAKNHVAGTKISMAFSMRLPHIAIPEVHLCGALRSPSQRILLRILAMSKFCDCFLRQYSNTGFCDDTHMRLRRQEAVQPE